MWDELIDWFFSSGLFYGMLLTHGNVPTPAVVCYAADRNELRSRVIQWLQTEVVPDGWFVKGSNFSDVLLKYFKVGFFPVLDGRDVGLN